MLGFYYFLFERWMKRITICIITLILYLRLFYINFFNLVLFNILQNFWKGWKSRGQLGSKNEVHHNVVWKRTSHPAFGILATTYNSTNNITFYVYLSGLNDEITYRTLFELVYTTGNSIKYCEDNLEVLNLFLEYSKNLKFLFHLPLPTLTSYSKIKIYFKFKLWDQKNIEYSIWLIKIIKILKF